MAIIIDHIQAGSPADGLGIARGDRLLRVNGREVNDLLDYGFYTAAEQLVLEIEDRTGVRLFQVRKDEDEPLGMESASFLMDEEHHCRNNCIFCFIDQLPEGLRDTLYFKDDDERLSFLLGNYITLTNLSDEDCRRIIDMRISPINISVHTTNPELRAHMMGNRFAGEKLQYLYDIASAGNEINCQIVLCRGVNDGQELERTLGDLTALFPAVSSIAVVPVGLTAHRRQLTPLTPYDRASANDVLEILEACHARCRKEHGVGLVYPADEFFLLAERDTPEIDYYDELSQLENGVGMLALFSHDFIAQLNLARSARGASAFTLVTGQLAAPTLDHLAACAKRKMPGMDYKVVAIRNDFFGGNVSVSGLVTATDILRQIDPAELRGRVLMPRNMLRSEGDLFLDSVGVADLEAALACKIEFFSGGGELAAALTGGR